MAKILVIGLNPAWQKVLDFQDFRAGDVNRAKTVSSLASGKGINAAKVLRRLGHEVWLLQILGGENGKRCLDGCEELGIRSLYAWVDEETRECFTLLHGADSVSAGPGGTTEIIEPFRVRQAGVWEALIGVLPEDSGFFDAVVVSGTVPAGIEAGIHETILEMYQPSVSVIDAWQGLGAAALERASCVKLNQSEFAALSAQLGPQGAGDALFLVTSGGGEASMLRSGNTLARLLPPRLSDLLNPIGAGDTATAGLTHFLLQGLKASEAFRRGMAMASASCLHPLPAEFTDEDYLALLPLVELRLVILFCASTEREMDACLGPLGAAFRDLPPAVIPLLSPDPEKRFGLAGGQARARSQDGHLFAVTGVGIPLTLARLMPLLAIARPELIVNMGIAGAYPATDIDIGHVVTASHESFGDLGIELPGPDPFEPISGFPWADPEYLQPIELAVAAYPRSVHLFPGAGAPFPIRMARGCTVNGCTGLEATGRRRRDLFGAEFESMEGAAAALAGKETGIPVCEVRAISNLASTRDMRPENITMALGNLGVYMAPWLESLK